MARDYLLWLGSFMTSASSDTTNAMSPAADRWQRELALATAELGVEVDVVSYVARQAWPRGPLGMSGARPVSVGPGVSVVQVPYSNVPWWRVGALTARRVATGMKSARREAPRAIISYNAHPNTSLAAFTLRHLTHAPWLCLVADLDSPSLLASRGPLALGEWTGLRAADARVFLSAAMAPQFTRANDLHLDGGVDAMHPFTPGEAGHVVYAGSLTPGAGVDLAIAAFKQSRHSRAKLSIYGNGDANRVRAIAGDDVRIDVRGLVPREELTNALANARVLLNPRLPHLPENARNFPSKLLDYLAYGKPIVSTWTAGLTERYRDLLVTAEADTTAFAAAMDSCLAMSEEALIERYDVIRAFAESHSWHHQAKRFLATIERLTQTE